MTNSTLIDNILGKRWLIEAKSLKAMEGLAKEY